MARTVCLDCGNQDVPNGKLCQCHRNKPLSPINEAVERFRKEFYPEDIAGKIQPDSFAQLTIDWISKELALAEQRTIEKAERIVRDVAHRNNLKVGTSAFGLHYEICSELANLKKPNQ